MCRFSIIPISYFVAINKMILKFTQRGKRPRRANTILKEKNNVRGLTLPNFKIKPKCYSNLRQYKISLGYTMSK